MVDSATKLSKSFWLYVEKYGPIVVSIVTVGLLALYDKQVVAHFISGSWKPSNLYTAIFNWAAIQTGFAFGVYGFVAGRQDGFVGAI